MADRIQFSVCSAIIIAACFIPQGAFALNPKIIGDVKLEGDVGDQDLPEDEQQSDGNSDRKVERPDLSPVVGV